VDGALTAEAVAAVPRIGKVATDPGTPDHDAVLNLLGLLADGAPVAEVAAAPGPARARELAVRVASSREVHQRREAGLHALLETARALVSEDDPAQVLDAIVRRARALLGTDLTYLTLYDPDRGDTYMRTTDGSVSAAFQSVRLDLGAGLGGLVASTRKPYWTADYGNDDRFRHTAAIDGAVSEEGIIAICGTPLIVDNDFVGVLFAANRTPRPFTREEVALLGNLATLAAVTLVQTRALADAGSALAALADAHETVQRYAEGVEKAAAAHDRFASLVLEGGGVDDLAHALVDLLGGWAVVVAEDGAVRCATRGAAVPEDFPDLGAGRVVRHAGVYGLAVATADERLATLYVGGVGELDEADRRTVERAGVVTALVLLFERQAAETRQSARNRVVTELVAGRGPADDRLRLARTSGTDPGGPFCLLVLRPEPGASPRTVALSAAAATGEGALAGQHDDHVVALVPGEDPDAAASRVASRCGRGATVTVAGVGPLTGVDDIPAAHAEALRTASALVALGHRGRGAAATQLGFAGLIVGGDPDVAEYVDRELGPLLDYDARRGTELVATLAAYFAAGRSPRHAARSLHVHVNTVAQRLERVTALLGEDWQEPERALELQLALRLQRLLPDAAG
jgi:GAF domain-containing protein